ncbi:MAG: DUF177 domain-containing protein [Cognatishimia sp.]|uniref:YceD family protein n=1 Tax=Cognatishimia sp. TaxID=2211648 RepID=UPI003B8E0FF7
MADKNTSKRIFRVADLSQNQLTDILLIPEADELKALADELKVSALKKLRFEGRLSALGKRDWILHADLGFTVTQPCVVTLEPVTTRVDTSVERQFVAGYESPDDEEFELTDDENTEALGAEINFEEVMKESLALALPLYPRKEDASLSEINFTEPGKKAMTDQDARPFAGLESLRNKLAGKGEK